MNEKAFTSKQIERMVKATKDLIATSHNICMEPTWSYDDYGNFVIKSMAPYQVKLLVRMGYSFCIGEDGATMYLFGENEEEEE